MKQEKELVKNTIIIAIGKVSTQIISFLLLPLYTSYLATEDYGAYDLIVTLAIFISPFVTLTLEESMFRYLIDAKNDKEKSSIMSITIIMTLVALAIFTIITLIIINIWKGIISPLLIPYTIAVVLMTVINALVRGLGKIKLFAMYNFVLSVITIILNIVFVVFFNMKGDGLLLSVIISNLLIILFIGIKVQIQKYVKIKNLNRELAIDMIKYSIPLIPHSLSWTIINLVDRLIITSILGISANGIHAVANKFPSIINTVYTYFSTAWKESASKALQENNADAYYSKIYTSIKKLMFAVTIGLIACMPFAFPIFINSSYNEAYMYIPIMAFAVFFISMANFYVGIFGAFKKTKTIGKTTVLSAVINLTIHLLLVKFIGLYAAAISTLVAGIFLYLYRRAEIKQFVKMKSSNDKIKQAIIILIVILAYYSKNMIIQAIVLLFVVAYSYLSNKEVIDGIFSNMIMKRFKKQNVQ